MGKTFKSLIMLLLCTLLLPWPSAFAAEDEAAEDSAAEEESLSSPADEKSIIDSIVLNAKIEALIEEKDLDPKRISVGYYYSATGDSWYYNGDKWFYPASMYKVPLVMLLAEKVSSGELSQDSAIYDGTVAEVEEHILTYSNNDWAHALRKYLGGDDVWREDAKKYAQLQEDEYDPDYLDYCYFNNRYMTQVMTTLYTRQESFPNVIDCLLTAEPEGYYRISLGEQYEIAQKYGSFEDSRCEKFNHCTAVIYTPSPFIVTVMTSNVTKYELLIDEIGAILAEYTLQLDGQLSDHQQYLEELAQEELRLQQEAEAAEQRRLEEQQRLEAEQEAQRLEAEAQAAKEKRNDEIKAYVIKGGAVLAGLLAAVFAIRFLLLSRRRKAERYEGRRSMDRRSGDGAGEAPSREHERRRGRREYPVNRERQYPADVDDMPYEEQDYTARPRRRQERYASDEGEAPYTDHEYPAEDSYGYDDMPYEERDYAARPLRGQGQYVPDEGEARQPGSRGRKNGRSGRGGGKYTPRH